jgi:Tol biopolymer transport system component
MQLLSDLQAYGKYDYLHFGGWSMDAKTIAFILLYPEDPSGNSLQRILRLDIDHGSVSTVLDSQQAGLYIDHNIALSPDGETILFSGSDLLEEEANDYLYALYRISSDGSGLRRLVNLDGWSLFQPVWSPDSSSFHVHASNHYHIIPLRYDLSGRLIGIPLFQFGRTMLSWRSAEFGK